MIITQHGISFKFNSRFLELKTNNNTQRYNSRQNIVLPIYSIEIKLFE